MLCLQWALLLLSTKITINLFSRVIPSQSFSLYYKLSPVDGLLWTQLQVHDKSPVQLTNKLGLGEKGYQQLFKNFFKRLLRDTWFSVLWKSKGKLSSLHSREKCTLWRVLSERIQLTWKVDASLKNSFKLANSPCIHLKCKSPHKSHYKEWKSRFLIHTCKSGMSLPQASSVPPFRTVRGFLYIRKVRYIFLFPQH